MVGHIMTMVPKKKGEVSTSPYCSTLRLYMIGPERGKKYYGEKVRICVEKKRTVYK
jgi:hypothetical protein